MVVGQGRGKIRMTFDEGSGHEHCTTQKKTHLFARILLQARLELLLAVGKLETDFGCGHARRDELLHTVEERLWLASIGTRGVDSPPLSIVPKASQGGRR